MKIITIEEHIPGTAIAAAAGIGAARDAPYMAKASGKGLPYVPDGGLFDICEERVADMDQYGIDVQVVSCASQSQYIPAALAPSIVKAANDELAAAISEYPDRFAALAALPWSNPEKAAQELERAVTRLGFKGAILSGRASTGKAFLDAPQFTPVLETAQALDVPIYIHPAAPMRNVQQSYYDGLGEQLSARLSLYGWGWHHEAGIQILRMILSGAFEKFPNLQLIAGHWGEMVPFFLSRLDQALPQSVTKLNRTITETFRQNIYVTPSGIFDYPQLKFCMEVLGAERIIHSVDFPFISNEGVRPFIENAPIRDAEKEKIAHCNAENLFKIKE